MAGVFRIRKARLEDAGEILAVDVCEGSDRRPPEIQMPRNCDCSAETMIGMSIRRALSQSFLPKSLWISG
jgi:hypothetical protein